MGEANDNLQKPGLNIAAKFKHESERNETNG